MAAGLRTVAGLADPVGEVVDGWVRPNGLRVTGSGCRSGVVGVIYENRPNVTSDAAGLCLKAGNAAFLRGSSSALALQPGGRGRAAARPLDKAGLPEDAVALVEDTSPRDGGRVHAAARPHRLPRPPGRPGPHRLHARARHRALRARRRRQLPRLRRRGRRPDDGASTSWSTPRPTARGVQRGRALLVHAAVADGLPARPGRRPRRGRGRAARRRAGAGHRARRHARPPRRTSPPSSSGRRWPSAVVDDLDAAIDHIARFGSGHSEAIVTADLRRRTGSPPRWTPRPCW